MKERKIGQKTALLFPGQGTQEVGMGEKLCRKYSIARHIYRTADWVLDYPIRDISFKGPEEKLNKTIYTQPAILVFNHALYEVLRDRKDFCTPAFVAGNSLGEYNALLTAGAFSFEGALKLIQARAESMQRACDTNPGGLLAVRNPSEEIKDKLMELGLEEALFNTQEQVVFGGSNDSLDEAVSWFQQNNPRGATRLNVAGAFHTSLMKPAVEPFSKALKKVEIRDCEIPVIANTTAEPIRKAEEIRQELINQLTRPVLWHKTIVYLDKYGVRQIFEVGEKKILTNMVNRIITGGAIGTMTIAGGVIAAVLWSRHHPHKS